MLHTTPDVGPSLASTLVPNYVRLRLSISITSDLVLVSATSVAIRTMWHKDERIMLQQRSEIIKQVMKRGHELS